MLTDEIQKELPGQVDALYEALRNLVAAADRENVGTRLAQRPFCPDELLAARATLRRFEAYAVRTAAAAGVPAAGLRRAAAAAGVSR